MSRKSQKKRHTKPCRYFQVNKCPYSADACDFAHVIASPVAPVPAEMTHGMCKYYTAGRCVGGVQCRYHHGPDASAPSLFEPPKYSERIADWAGASTNATYPESPIHGAGYNPYNWPPPLYPPTGSFPSTRDSILFSAPRSCDSIDTSTSISSVDSDDVIVVTSDPKYSEHSHSHQSQVCIADDSPVIHVPPFYPTLNGVYSPTSPYDYSYGGMVGSLKLPLPMKPRLGPKSVSKQKILKYKTKPCKFFSTEKGCPNGLACTFIHDEGYPVIPTASKHLRCSSSIDEGERKRFFPIPWRVIGGGVLVGVKKEEEENDADSEYEYIEKSAPAKPYNCNSVAPIKIIARQRSNSIPPTPSTTQVRVEHLFSAESPGVL